MKTLNNRFGKKNLVDFSSFTITSSQMCGVRGGVAIEPQTPAHSVDKEVGVSDNV